MTPAYTADATYRRWPTTAALNSGQWIYRADGKGRTRQRVRNPFAHIETDEFRKDGQPLKPTYGNGNVSPSSWCSER